MSKYKYGTTMLVKEETKNRLDVRGVKNQSYDGILNEIIDKCEKYEKLEAMPEFQKFLVKIDKIDWLNKEIHEKRI